MTGHAERDARIESGHDEVAGLRKAAAADRAAALTPEALEAWGDKFVTRVAEAARTEDAPGDDAAAVQIGKIEETVAELTAEVRRQNAELSSIGDELKAARTDDTSGDAAAAARVKRIEDAAAKAAAAAERMDGMLDSTVDRVAAEIGGAATRIEKDLMGTRTHVTLQSRQADPILEDIRTQTAGPRFGLRTVFVWLVVLVFGMLLESRVPILYSWLWAP